jgi:hypothetical protein
MECIIIGPGRGVNLKGGDFENTRQPVTNPGLDGWTGAFYLYSPGQSDIKENQ